jgi:hypothetical protein
VSVEYEGPVRALRELGCICGSHPNRKNKDAARVGPPGTFSSRIDFQFGAIMSEVLFPRRRIDGSFCVAVSIGIKEDDPTIAAAKISSWLSQWVPANRHWKTSLYGEDESLDFFAEFAEITPCGVDESGLLSFRLEVRSGAKKRWKDCLVLRLLRDI